MHFHLLLRHYCKEIVDTLLTADDKKIIRKMNRTRKEKKRLADLAEQEYQQQPHVIKRRKEITPYLEYKKSLKNNDNIAL